MDHHRFTTPPPQTVPNVPPAVGNVVTISKAAILDLISKFPFEEVSLPTTVVSNDETQTVPFIEALGSSLIKTLISLIPKHSSPRKLISSSTLSRLPQPEQESPAKPPKHDNMSREQRKLLALQRFDGKQGDMSRQQRKLLALQRLDEKQGTTTFKAFTLTQTDAAPLTYPEPTPPKWDHPPPVFRRMDPVIDKARFDVLRKTKIDNCPYYIARLERKPGELHPFVWVRGKLHSPVDDDGNLEAGFDKDYYSVQSLAMLDTGNDVTIVTQEYLGIQLHGPTRVFFNLSKL
jgi:hypothetical protein